MTKPERKTSYQRAVERAKARGYASPYAERKAKSQARGFSSPRTELSARREARGQLKRDYAFERLRADQLAYGRGFENAAAERRFKRELKSNPTLDKNEWQKARTLAMFGITESQFNRMRTANKKWNDTEADYRDVTKYKKELDKQVHNWTPYRVGYIVTYYRANVDPKTNYRDSGKYFTKGKKTSHRKWEYGYRVMDQLQYDLMVTYGDLSDSAWRAHYGPTFLIK